MTNNYDLIVIGAGMAGNAAANKCASAGWRVAIVDELPYGGTCALRGCDPKKILRRGAEIIDSARLMAGKGIDADGLHDQLGRPDAATSTASPTPSRRTWNAASPATASTRCTAPPRFTGPNTPRHRRHRLHSRALPDRHRRPPPTARLPRRRAPHRQHRLPRSRRATASGSCSSVAGSSPSSSPTSPPAPAAAPIIVDHGPRPLEGVRPRPRRPPRRPRRRGRYRDSRRHLDRRRSRPTGDGYRGHRRTTTATDHDRRRSRRARRRPDPELARLDLDAADVEYGTDAE